MTIFGEKTSESFSELEKSVNPYIEKAFLSS